MVLMLMVCLTRCGGGRKIGACRVGAALGQVSSNGYLDIHPVCT